jgi:hypothetical protein
MLEDEVRLALVYFEGVDSAGHSGGFLSDGVKAAIQRVDSAIDRLYLGVIPAFLSLSFAIRLLLNYSGFAASILEFAERSGPHHLLGPWNGKHFSQSSVICNLFLSFFLVRISY